MSNWPLGSEGPCACKFTRIHTGEFSEVKQLEWCSLHKKQQESLDELKKYFTSGNEIPVERATILAKDFWRIVNPTIKDSKDNT